MIGRIDCEQACNGCWPLEDPNFTGEIVDACQHGANVRGNVRMTDGSEREYGLATYDTAEEPGFVDRTNARVGACKGMEARNEIIGAVCGAGIVELVERQPLN